LLRREVVSHLRVWLLHLCSSVTSSLPRCGRLAHTKLGWMVHGCMTGAKSKRLLHLSNIDLSCRQTAVSGSPSQRALSVCEYLIPKHNESLPQSTAICARLLYVCVVFVHGRSRPTRHYRSMFEGTTGLSVCVVDKKAVWC
jgi:hypothetical protein